MAEEKSEEEKRCIAPPPYGFNGIWKGGTCHRRPDPVKKSFSVKVAVGRIQNSLKVYANDEAQAKQYAQNIASPLSPASAKVVSINSLAPTCSTSGSFSVIVNGVNTEVFAPTLAAAKIIAAKQVNASRFASARVGSVNSFNPCATGGATRGKG